MKAPRLISGRAFAQALIDAGVIRAEDCVRRIILDIGVSEAPVMYIERYGDERLLSVVTSLEGITVMEKNPEQPPVETREGYAETRGGADTQEWSVDPEGAGAAPGEKQPQEGN